MTTPQRIIEIENIRKLLYRKISIISVVKNLILNGISRHMPLRNTNSRQRETLSNKTPHISCLYHILSQQKEHRYIQHLLPMTEKDVDENYSM